MNETDLDTDLEMERRLHEFADGTRTPPLPTETAALPWSVQSEGQPTGIRRWLPAVGTVTSRAARAAFVGARLTATFAVAFGLLFLASSARTGGSAADIVGPQQTIRPSPPLGAPNGPEVVVLPTSGVVDDVMAGYVTAGVNRAEADGAAAVVVQLDTLGGSSSSMTTIYKALENAKIPTIVWVGPSGAKAASAGTFITLAAGLAYMAPGTNIGAASPVASGGQNLTSVVGTTEAAKVLQDAVAAMTSIAQLRHRPVDVAIATVESAQSYSAEDARTKGLIDDTAVSLNDVLNKAEGKTVTVNGGSATVTVHTAGATVVTIDQDLMQSILQGLDDPNIAFILLVLGILCIAIEFFHPTLFVGIVGAFALALSFYGAGSLPLNLLGVVLVVLGLVMFLLEPTIPSHGLLTAAGLVSFIVGASAFYGSPGPYQPAVSVAWPIIVVMAAVGAAYGLLLISTLLRMRHQAVPVGSGLVGTVDVIGMSGVVEKDLAPLGTAYVAGESWSAKLAGGGSAPRGSRVKVVRKEGLTLVVETVE